MEHTHPKKQILSGVYSALSAIKLIMISGLSRKLHKGPACGPIAILIHPEWAHTRMNHHDSPLADFPVCFDIVH